ncbi:MAG TPA: DNA-protecting protein DprA [Fastidiosipila sp.]|nr:DNA-protecting protein DprA [Fastidiosipila sp.]
MDTFLDRQHQLSVALFLSQAIRHDVSVSQLVTLHRGVLLSRFYPSDERRVVRDDREKRLYEAFISQRHSWREQARRYLEGDIFVWEPSPDFFRSKLFHASAPPPYFYVRSKRRDLLPLAEKTIAVVGSRQPSAYGIAVTKRIVSDLVQEDIVVISGGAAGIDGTAHQAALDAGGLTVAILGHGVDHVYPAKHRHLFDAIRRHGWLLSEYPPGTTPKRHFFPARNRLVAALSDALIVTAAKPKSGTLITASFAADQGKPVFAVPGSILDDEAASCHLLIKEGAGLYTDISDLNGIFPET